MRSAALRRSMIGLLLASLALSACDGPEQRAASTRGGEQGADEPLPAPAGAAGGVTGMPAKPGPGHVGLPEPAPEVALDAEGNPLLPVDGTTGETTPVAPPAAAEPGPAEAVAVIRDYYAAINRGEFGRAHALWADGGRASGQTPEQFAAGFADTTGISVEVLAPGPVQAGAGSRHIEVPVAFTSTLRDGSQRRYVGAYVLQRGAVDGATPEQAAWRIASADLRAVAP